MNYFRSLERRISFLESLIYEGKKDLEDLRVYLGDELFDSYMNIRNKIPSESDLNKQFPEFTVEYILEKPENARQFLKKYSNLRKHNIISNLGDYLFTKVPPEASIDRLEDSLLDYDDMRNYVFETLDSFRDFQKLKRLSIDDIRNFVDSYTSVRASKDNDKVRGARKIYEDSDWVVYYITEYSAAKYYGRGTKWCIAGNYPGHESRGEEHFNNYINKAKLDGGYYFYINKHDPTKKYAVLRQRNGKIHSIWDATDTYRGKTKVYTTELPDVPGVDLPNKATPKDLREAVLSGNKEAVKTLLESGINPNKMTGLKTPILIEAANLIYDGSDDVLKLLLDYGANPNIATKSGQTPLMSSGNANKVKILLDYGADPNQICFLDRPAIFFHATPMRLDFVKALIDGGADIDTPYGNPPKSLLEYLEDDVLRYNDRDKKQVLDFIIKYTGR